MKVTKEMLFGFYAFLSLVFGFVGYFIGKNSDKGEMYGLAGLLLGVVLSVLLYFTVGKKMVDGDY